MAGRGRSLDEIGRKRMRRLAERWRRSGETASAFAERHGLSRYQFQYWRDQFGLVKHRGARPAGRPKPAAPPTFAPVRVLDDLRAGSTPLQPTALEIRLAGGDVVRCGGEVPLSSLSAVVRLLRERC